MIFHCAGKSCSLIAVYIKAQGMFGIEEFHEHPTLNFVAVITAPCNVSTNNMAATQTSHIPTVVSKFRLSRLCDIYC
jgi:hypothetical protein